MREMFFSDDYMTYLKEVFDEAHTVIEPVASGKKSMDYFQGAMDMLQGVLMIPDRTIEKTDPEHEEIIQKLEQIKAVSFAKFETSLIRRAIMKD